MIAHIIVFQKCSKAIAHFDFQKIIISDGPKCFASFEFQSYFKNLDT